MHINLAESEGDFSLLSDLSKYHTVNEWLDSMSRMETSFYPIDCDVIIDSERYTFISGGQVYAGEGEVSNFALIMAKLMQLPKERRLIPNDDMNISADLFDETLEVKL
jgi:hypothetical protein